MTIQEMKLLKELSPKIASKIVDIDGDNTEVTIRLVCTKNGQEDKLKMFLHFQEDFVQIIKDTADEVEFNLTTSISVLEKLL